MVASTLVRQAFGDKDLAANFSRDFMAGYAATAFGVLPKTEIDLLVFSLLVKAKVIDADGSIYRTARALISPWSYSRVTSGAPNGWPRIRPDPWSAPDDHL
ncbi:MAG TPA: hypothetical protein VGI79_11720 [Caulobacteraceae bacterium]|jgi:hypothetical protein